nr:uncharacterized protein LOC119620508 isoform X2 [Chlorocebus sabaeus]
MARVGGKARGRMLPCNRVRFLQKGRTKVTHGPSGDLGAAWWPGTPARGRGPFQGVSLQGSPGRKWARGSLTSPLHHPHPGGYRSAATPRCSRKTPRLQHLHGDAARLRSGPYASRGSDLNPKVLLNPMLHRTFGRGGAPWGLLRAHVAELTRIKACPRLHHTSV